MPHRQPVGPLFGRYIGTAMSIQGRQFTITNILSEQADRHVNEYWIVFEATSLDGPAPVIVKARFELPNAGIAPEWAARVRREAERCFRDEADSLEACLDLGPQAFPTYMAKDLLVQGGNDPLPGGYIRVIVMSKVPGRSVVDQLRSLTPADRATIRTQLARTLEQIRLKGFTFSEEETEQIFYDARNRAMYLTGFSRIGRELGPPRDEYRITEDSVNVTAFGMGWASNVGH
ncbi:hypothetical protein BO70DRAFT_405070 [Aspergillus terreus]|uniref:Uncharacterized protein n=1 Tax=Aspergillus terreus TaxID=33178 RepID=A0A5M3ZGF3_ASPTE|nr:hypothetical protein ATETN484_0014025000 [Aspergillus terreus]GFF20916.1 hypothetical protein BO70DRAFT_405070 [Aspergillus terreus]